MTDPRTFTRAQLRAYLSGMQWREVLERIDSGQLPGPANKVQASSRFAVWDRKAVDRALEQEVDRAFGTQTPPIFSARMPRSAPHNHTSILDEVEILAAAVDYEPASGVYFLISRGRIVYIGQAADVFARVADHERSNKRFDKWHWIPCEEGCLDTLERDYLKKFKPILNVDGRTKMLRSTDVVYEDG